MGIRIIIKNGVADGRFLGGSHGLVVGHAARDAQGALVRTVRNSFIYFI